MADFASYLGDNNLFQQTGQQMFPAAPTIQEGQMSGGGISGWLAKPENQLALMKMGKAIAPTGIAGKEPYTTAGANIAAAFQPGVEGQVGLDKAKQAESGVIQGTPKPSSALGGVKLGEHPGTMLESPHVMGFTMKNPDGSSYTIKSPGPKDYADAQVIQNQIASGQTQSATPASTALGNQSPFVASQQGAGTVGNDFLPALYRAEGTGGRDYYDDGRPIVSPKGAMYAMQVMPSTAANPGFGIPPAANDSPEEYNKVGRMLFSALQQKYGGDRAKAFAAYNAGTGAVDRAIAVAGDNYLSVLPAETQKYVPNALGQAGGTSSPVRLAQADIGQVTDIPVSYEPSGRASSVLSGINNAGGLSLEQLNAAIKMGLEASHQPYINANTAAVTSGLEARTRTEQAELPTKAPMRLTLPGGQSVVVQGKDVLNYQQHKDLNELNRPMKEAQELLTNEKAQTLLRRQRVLDTIGNEKVPGTDKTYKELEALGVLDDQLRVNQQANAITAANERQEKTAIAAERRMAMAKIHDAFSKYRAMAADPVLGSDFREEAKLSKIPIDRLIEMKVAQEFPDWKRIMGIQSGEKINLNEELPAGKDPLKLFSK